MRTSRYSGVCVRQYQSGLGWATKICLSKTGRGYVAYLVKTPIKSDRLQSDAQYRYISEESLS